MTKAEKNYYINQDCIAYYSGFAGIEIKEVEYGIDDYIIFVAGAWCSKKSVHRSKVYYTAAERAYFKLNGSRIPLGITHTRQIKYICLILSIFNTSPARRGGVAVMQPQTVTSPYKCRVQHNYRKEGKLLKVSYTTPPGKYYTLYKDMLQQPHLLIAGATGSGKSIVVNGIITTALYDSPAAVQFIFIDPKRVELVEFRNLPHCVKYASEPGNMAQAFRDAMTITESRYKDMQRAGVKKYPGGAVYVVIDELADLMTTNKREVMPLLQRLAQIGRAANIHLIAATQCPLSAVIPTPIKVNFDSRIALRTRSAQDSRNILGCKGCELLPRYGQGYYMTPAGLTLYNIPMYTDAERAQLVTYWTHTKPARRHWFSK